jgi:hypothetical protein
MQEEEDEIRKEEVRVKNMENKTKSYKKTNVAKM